MVTHDRYLIFDLFSQMTQYYYDLCSALEINGAHKEALRMKAELEERAANCKNQV